MKKPLSALLVVVMLLSLVSCSATGVDTTGEFITGNPTKEPATESMNPTSDAEQSPSVLDISSLSPLDRAKRLWKVDIGNGFVRSLSSHDVVRGNGDYTMKLSVCPEEFKPTIPPDAKQLMEGDKEYQVWEGLEDDFVNKTKEKFTSMFWQRDGFAYTISMIGREGTTPSSDIVKTDAVKKLEEEPSAPIGDYRIFQNWLYTKFMKGETACYVQLFFDGIITNVERSIPADKQFTKIGDGDFECFLKKLTYDTLTRIEMYWYSDAGVFCLTVVAPTKASENPGTLDFVNLDLAKRVTQQMGAKMKPFPNIAKIAGAALQSEAPLPPSSEKFIKLCQLDSGNGCICIDASRKIEWYSKEAAVRTEIQLITWLGGYGDIIPFSAETLQESGQKYHLVQRQLPSGFSRALYWEKDGLYYRLLAKVKRDYQKDMVNIITPKLAETLMKDPYAEIEKYDIQDDDSWEIRFNTSANDGENTLDIKLTYWP